MHNHKTLSKGFKPIAAGYVLVKDGDILIIGMGGGRSVVEGLMTNQRSITAVEVNPVTVDILKKHFADYVGHILDDPRVNVHVEEGRSFVQRSKDTYDLIELRMVDTWGSHAQAVNSYIFLENNLYTKEAINSYAARLKPEGVLSITRFYGYGEGLRLLNTMVEALEEKGVTDIPKHFMVVLDYPFGEPAYYHRATILYKKTPFQPSDTARLMEFKRQRGYYVIYAPFLDGKDMVQSDTARSYRQILAGTSSRLALETSQIKDISPTVDDKPFFFFTTRLKDIFHLDRDEHPVRRLGLPMLCALCGAVTLLSFGMTILPLRFFAGPKARLGAGGFGMVYFALIGLGYMLIELSLIQRLTVFIGQPIFSLVAVLTCLLLSSAVGSLLSGRLVQDGLSRRLGTILTGVVVCCALIASVVFNWLAGLMWLNLPLRIAVSAAFIIPLGVLMGMCFPLGVRLIQEGNRMQVAWAWGTNGAFSVLGSVLSMLLALYLGLKITFVLGGACYAIAFLAKRKIIKEG